MTRLEELETLMKELENTPPALEYTLQRAEERLALRKRRLRNFVIFPTGSLIAAFAIFVVMVNSSAAFASACGNIPLIRDLAAAVAFSPSLSAAVENKYVQPIEQEQTKNGIIMRIEYVIVDQKQLNVFYSLDSDVYSDLEVRPSILAKDGTSLQGYGIVSYGPAETKGKLQYFSVHFTGTDMQMPDSLQLSCDVYDRRESNNERPDQAEDDLINGAYHFPDVIATFTFTLEFDPYYTAQGDTIAVSQSFMIDGQKLTITSAEIYPTHLCINLADVPENTAWLKELSFYVEDEKGRRFDRIFNGLTGIGSSDSPMISAQILESTFFAKSKKLTLYIEGAVLLDKTMERIKLNLNTGEADRLPEGVELEQVEKKDNSWILTFSGKKRAENGAHQLFGTQFYDEAGNKYEFNHWSATTGIGYYDNASQQYVEKPEVFQVRFTLVDYPYDAVYLCPEYSHTVTLDKPIKIRLK